MAQRSKAARVDGLVDQEVRVQTRVELVDAVPGQLERVLAFLWSWPRTAHQAVWLLRDGGEATIAECVCARWRAAAALARPPSAPVLDTSPDGRRCFSAPAGQPCGWFWVEALLGLERFVGVPLNQVFAEAWRAVHDGTFSDRVRPFFDPDGCMEPLVLEQMELAALREVGAAHEMVEAQQLMWWGLDVATACNLLWRHPVSCQVTLFLDRLYMARQPVEPRRLELQLDMSRHHWLLMRAREPQERVYVRGWQLRCYGNGAAAPASL